MQYLMTMITFNINMVILLSFDLILGLEMLKPKYQPNVLYDNAWDSPETNYNNSPLRVTRVI
jgi:hypothetical protein